MVAAPEEAFESEHFVARGFPVEVEHDDLGRTYRYPGAPFLMPASPWRISRRAPQLGEHDAEILGELTWPRASPCSARRLRDDVPGRLRHARRRPRGPARTFPGFVEFKMFVAADGERLALVTFASDDTEAAWRDDAQHRAAQQRGRDEFYAEYDVAVCSVRRRHTWPSGT